MVSGDVPEMEKALAGDEEVDLTVNQNDGEEIHLEQQLPEVSSAPLPSQMGRTQDTVHMYLLEASQTPLLDADEEKHLGSRIEEGRYLLEVEQNWADRYGWQPSPMDLLPALSERFCKARLLLKALCWHLNLPREPLVKKMHNPALRRAIDGRIAPELISTTAQATGLSRARTRGDVIQLSLNSRLLPWDLLGEAAAESTVAEFEKVLKSREFQDWLAKCNSGIAWHFEQIRERAERAERMEIQYGAEVVDKNGKLLGKVDHLVRNTWTGEISKFMVRRKAPDRDLLLSPQDVLELTQSRITLGIALHELEE